MRIETKLTLNNMRKNIKRTIFTIISITLCTTLILTTMLVISSIRAGIAENIETEYNDYHFIIRDLDSDSFNKIKDKEYIDKIYIQENNDKQLDAYIRYKNIKKVCNYSNDIIKTLNLSIDEINKNENKCEFNQRLLTIYGLIDVEIREQNYSPICVVRVNYSYALDIMIIVILLVFSILSIIILYNAFLITITERKKEYAILNSIGGTEEQILKMIFLEATIMGIIGIFIGGTISYLSANIILKLLNNIITDAGYNFKLMFDIKYIVLSILLVIFNIYISAIIPSVKASTTSVIQEIRNNKQIKYKKRNSIIEKLLPIEGKMAFKNLKRNKNKYRVITILLVICMTSYIVISTYINYEKETAELVSEYDVDAELYFEPTSNIDYKSIFEDYEEKYGDTIKYMEYQKTGLTFLVEPEEALATDNLVKTYKNNKKSIDLAVIGLDDKTYNNYINKINADYGDVIIYNNVRELSENENLTYTYYPGFKKGYNLKLSLIATYNDYENEEYEYEVMDTKNLEKNIILTDELIEGYKEVKTAWAVPTIFINMEEYNQIEETIDNYNKNGKYNVNRFIISDNICVKIKCNNIIEFSKYIENIKEKQGLSLWADYYSLNNQEKIIYINIIQLILKIIIISITAIGIISTINIINASLCERKQDFNILYSLGATEENLNKILIYECVYMYIKATIISIILSIPIIYCIIKYMENIIILSELLIPFKNICLFIIVLFIISLFVTLYSKRFMEKGKTIVGEKI